MVDDKKHIYGIVVNTLGFPIVYNLFAEDSKRWSSQLFPIGIDCDGNMQFYDTDKQIYRTFRLVKNEEK